MAPSAGVFVLGAPGSVAVLAVAGTAAAAFVFTANGVPYTIANGQVSTVGPGQSAPFEIGVPVPEHQSLSLSLTVQDASIQLELRK